MAQRQGRAWGVRARNWLGVGLLVVGCAGAARAEDPPGVYVAESPEPTAAETLMLEYVNRLRADPAGDIERCLATRTIPDEVNRTLFTCEMATCSPAAPVFFDLSLVKAARWHSYYQVHNGMSHEETPGAVGFSGETPWERVQLAGFEHAVSENVMLDARSPWFQHTANVIEWGEDPATVQPGRPHRRNMLDPRAWVVGVGAVPHERGGSFAVTFEFGAGEPRLIGGVVYRDSNHNHFYDEGEGVDAVSLRLGEQECAPFASGAYSIASSTQAGWLRVAWNGGEYHRYVPAGEENVKVDFVLSQAGRMASASDLLEQLAQVAAAEDPDRLFAARVAADVGIRSKFLQGSQEECAALLAQVQPAREAYAIDQQLVREAVSEGEFEAAEALCRDMIEAYRQTVLADWFSDALVCLRMQAEQRTFTAAVATDDAVEEQVARQFQSLWQQRKQLETPEWRGFASGVFRELLGEGEL